VHAVVVGAVVVEHLYVAENADELSLMVGQRLRARDTGDAGWWFGEDLATGRSGVFPNNFVKVVQGTYTQRRPHAGSPPAQCT
jgi:hypothetical protein